jgi:histidinol-phosphate aminotransferase
MAALRLGMAFADERIIAVLNKIKPPYNINILTQETALQALYHTEWKDRIVHTTVRERERLAAELEQIHIVERVFPSDANFILVQFLDARNVYAALVQRNIIVRDRSGVALCDDCLRITVGTPAENRLLLDALADIAR